MLLFAAALVVGQARADLSPEGSTLPVVSIPTASPGLATQSDRIRLASIRYLVEIILPSPENVELTNDVSAYPADDEITTATGLLE